MVTRRDKEILRWVEEYKSITINQCSKIFFTKNKQAYDQARKRLSSLHKQGLLNRYRKDPKSEAIYYMDKKLKVHDLKIFDVVAEFIYFGWDMIQLSKEYIIYVEGKKYVLDAGILFKKADFYLLVYLEIDYSHFTSLEKINNIVNDHVHTEYKELFIIIKLTQEKAAVSTIENKNAHIIYLPWNLTGLSPWLSPRLSGV